MAKHKHAELMLQYAKDWAETDEPWKRWVVTSHRNEWVALFGHPYWREESEYRRKPCTLTYTITVPEPLREAPEVGEVYYVAAPEVEYLWREYWWAGSELDRRWLKRGLCFATKEDATAAAEAMLPFKQEAAIAKATGEKV